MKFKDKFECTYKKVLLDVERSNDRIIKDIRSVPRIDAYFRTIQKALMKGLQSSLDVGDTASINQIASLNQVMDSLSLDEYAEKIRNQETPDLMNVLWSSAVKSYQMTTIIKQIKSGKALCIHKSLKNLEKLPVVIDKNFQPKRAYILFLEEAEDHLFLVMPYKYSFKKPKDGEPRTYRGVELIKIGGGSIWSAIIHDTCIAEDKEADLKDVFYVPGESEDLTEKQFNKIFNAVIAYEYKEDEIEEIELNPQREKLEGYIKRGYKVQRHKKLLEGENSLKFIDVSLFSDKAAMKEVYKQKRNGEPLWRMKPHTRRAHDRTVWVRQGDTKVKKVIHIDEMSINGGVKNADYKEIEVLKK